MHAMQHPHRFFSAKQARYRESLAAINFAPPAFDRLHKTFTKPSLTQSTSDSNPSVNKLCASHIALDLITLFQDGIPCETLPSGVRVRKGIAMGWSDEIYLNATFCALCRLLVEMGETRMSGDERDVEFWSIITLRGHEALSSVAEPLYEVVDEIRQKDNKRSMPEEAIYLALVRTVKAPPGYRFEYRTMFREMLYVGLLDSEKLIPSRSLSLRDTGDETEIVKRTSMWFKRCEKHKTCQSRKADVTSFPDGFRLFDIASLQIVEASGGEQYIALSYCWAQVEKFRILKQGKAYALDALPRVLQDIIRFIRALNLGINNIWMDQLCVDQIDSEQKRSNINAMGTIYSAAFATIILAVPFQGRPERGLPGISVSRLPYQHGEKVGKLKLATILPSVDNEIAISLWLSRGWTLQEGILSSRCIVFGPNQIYFECAEMGCCECVWEPNFAESEHDRLIPYKSRLQNLFMLNYDFHELYRGLLQDYTSRNLSLDSDALNAFSAFAKEFERIDQQLTWGLPITNISQYLMWEHSPWDFRAVYRRREFPSWSWAGWCGTAVFNFSTDLLLKLQRVSQVTQEPPFGRVLRCNARTAQIVVSGTAPLCSVDETSISSIMMDCGMNDESISLPRACTFMEIFSLDSVIYGLCLDQKGENYERIGTGFAQFKSADAVEMRLRELKIS